MSWCSGETFGKRRMGQPGLTARKYCLRKGFHFFSYPAISKIHTTQEKTDLTQGLFGDKVPQAIGSLGRMEGPPLLASRALLGMVNLLDVCEI